MFSQRSRTRSISIFRLFIDAVKGKPQDFTEGSIDRAIFLLAVPMILEMAMESLFAVVDVFFVSRLGANAITTIGLTELVLTLVYTLAIGISISATALVARRTGEKNHDAAAHAGVQTIYIGIGISLLISIVGFFYSDDILALMGAEEGVIREGRNYIRIMLCGNSVIFLLFLINGVFRGVGNAAIAMRSLWIANGINIILCPTFILGLGPFPELGLTGAAVATTIGRGCGVLYQLYHMVRGSKLLPMVKKHLLFSGEIIGKILKTSIGGTLQFFIASCSWIFLGRFIAEFGTEAMSGQTIAIRIIVFAILPAWGMANAAATLVGQNLGAGKPDRAEQSVWRAGFLNLVFLGIVSVIFIILAPNIIRIFSDDPQIIAYGTESLRYISIGYIFYAYGMVIPQAFNGAGDTLTPTLINLFGFWGFQIPLAYLLAFKFDLGPTGVFMSIPIAEIVIAIAGIIIFKKGKWKKVKI
ncbi:MAG: MATE family efflux transporter [Chitinophagaceae bacterium]